MSIRKRQPPEHPAPPSARIRPLALLGVLALAGCASAPVPPSLALQAAEQAIARAERDHAGNRPPVELAQARVKLEAARGAVADKAMLRAERLAEQSRVEAELASALGGLERAGRIDEQLREGNDALEEELRRKAGEQP